MKRKVGSHALLGIRLGTRRGGRGLLDDVGIRHVSRVVGGNARGGSRRPW
jgi:hypothetical protein